MKCLENQSLENNSYVRVDAYPYVSSWVGAIHVWVNIVVSRHRDQTLETSAYKKRKLGNTCKLRAVFGNKCRKRLKKNT